MISLFHVLIIFFVTSIDASVLFSENGASSKLKKHLKRGLISTYNSRVPVFYQAKMLNRRPETEREVKKNANNYFHTISHDISAGEGNDANINEPNIKNIDKFREVPLKYNMFKNVLTTTRGNKDIFQINKMKAKTLTDLVYNKPGEHYMEPIYDIYENKNFRRKDVSPAATHMNRTESHSSYSIEESSSKETLKWKTIWSEYWMKKKVEALNSTLPDYQVVNMAAARPWGVPCGDPQEHDVPWGRCALGVECDAEYRLYRGDFFCEASQFVCCALQLTSYDLYNAIDASFEEKSLSTDTEEKRQNAKVDNTANKRSKAKIARGRDREKRKKKIKRIIAKITKEIKVLLDTVEKNGTLARKKKTKMLKKYIKALKQKFKADRTSIKELHTVNILYIDKELTKKLLQLKAMNHAFIGNKTFQDIIINGTITKEGARILLDAYPQLKPLIPFKFRRHGKKNHTKLRPSRRFLFPNEETTHEKYELGKHSADKSKHFEYDIEYGILYI